MHRMRNEPKTRGGPETTGATIHWASQYDLFTSLLGFGVNSRNSHIIVEMAQIKAGDRVLKHVTLALVGHRMMQINLSGYPALLTKAGFVEVVSGKTASIFLAFVSGKKPVA